MAAQRARMHHLIPESYLLRFAGDDGRLLVTDKPTGVRKRIHPRVLMRERDYYTVETVEGPSDEIERWLSTLEGATAEVLRRIEAGAFPPTGQDLGVLATFLGFQFCRGRQFQEMLETMVQGTTELGARLLASHPDAMRAAVLATQGHDPPPDEVHELQEVMRSALDEDRLTTTVPRSYSVELMIDTAPEVAKILAQRSWLLAETPTPAFITGDVPFVLASAPLPDGRPMPLGVMTAQEITFPVDSRRCIVLGKPGGPQGLFAVPIDAELIQTSNERTFHAARRFTFGHPAVSFTCDQELHKADAR